MTDNEIIKALECHADYHSDNCFECPYLENLSAFDKNCVILMTEDVLDLINRQKAEIERANCHIHKLVNVTDDLVHECDCAKQEAIKEFAERLKESKKQFEGTLAGFTFTMTELDNLVKEFTEGKNEDQ